MKFFICKHCGNIITYLHASGVPIVCCGEKMQELVPNTSDASNEKHVPVIHKTQQKFLIHIGSADHPMLEEHSIQWIVLETQKGYQYKKLNPKEPPEAEFTLCDGEEAIAAYAYCNLHGLWEKKL